MRRNNGTLNSQLSRVISEVGHTDQLVVTDAGLPIPPHVERVDLALRKGVPSFLEVLEVILDEVSVESALLSDEIRTTSPDMLYEIEIHLRRLKVVRSFVPHVEFKATTSNCRAAVRSGEFTPFANIILTAGAVY